MESECCLNRQKCDWGFLACCAPDIQRAERNMPLNEDSAFKYRGILIPAFIFDISPWNAGFYNKT